MEPASQPTEDRFITVAIEPSGAAYFVTSTTPKGLGAGLRLSVPFIAGFEAVAGYTFIDVKSTALPMMTHQAYGGIAYRLDDFHNLSPWFEAGAGFFDFDLQTRGEKPVYDLALHVGAGLDVAWRLFFVGAFLRYEIYLLTGLTNFPAALTAGLRLGIRIPF